MFFHLLNVVNLLLTLDRTAVCWFSLQVAFWNILLLLMNMGPSAVSVILLGAYSDKAGRRKPMTIAVLGTTLRSLTGMCSERVPPYVCSLVLQSEGTTLCSLTGMYSDRVPPWAPSQTCTMKGYHPALLQRYVQ